MLKRIAAALAFGFLASLPAQAESNYEWQRTCQVWHDGVPYAFEQIVQAGGKHTSTVCVAGNRFKDGAYGWHFTRDGKPVNTCFAVDGRYPTAFRLLTPEYVLSGDSLVAQCELRRYAPRTLSAVEAVELDKAYELVTSVLSTWHE